MEPNKTNLISEEELESVAGGLDVVRKRPVVTSDYGCNQYICTGCSYMSLEKRHSDHCRLEEEYRGTCYGCRYFEKIGMAEGQIEGYCKVNG